MYLQLPTQPEFLRQHFPRVRKRLKGVDWAKTEVLIDHQRARAEKVAVFDADVDKKRFSTTLEAITNRIRAGLPFWQTDTTDTVEIPEIEGVAEVSAPWLSKKVFASILTMVTIGSVLVAAALFVPAAYYAFFPADVIEVSAPEPGTAFGGDFAQGDVQDEQAAQQEAEKEPEQERYQPPVDPSLPEGDWLIIPRIGVRSQLRATEEPEEALAKGIWWVPDFGKPGDEELPMIAAAHRYGWKWWWKDDYWKYHSFNKLPETEPGDRIEVISNQQKWEYEIYAGEEGDEITDYSADLILYTCKFLSGPVRHFRYARLIDPTTNTQATQLGGL